MTSLFRGQRRRGHRRMEEEEYGAAEYGAEDGGEQYTAMQGDANPVSVAAGGSLFRRYAPSNKNILQKSS